MIVRTALVQVPVRMEATVRYPAPAISDNPQRSPIGSECAGVARSGVHTSSVNARRCYDETQGDSFVTVIELSDEQAAALNAKAAAEGLTLEAWFRKLAEEEPSGKHPLQTAADIVLKRICNVPPEIMEAMPQDGASQHDHYIYGWPKTEA
jgi:hypothetical protein